MAELKKEGDQISGEESIKREQYRFKKQQKEKERLLFHRNKKIKKILLWGCFILIGGLVILGGGWFLVKRTSVPESEIISQNGIHWHTELSISILGQKQQIPANIGIGIVHNPIHTHEEDNVIHLEFEGHVRKEDLRPGNFFEIWGQQFTKDCIFEKCTGPEGTLKMLVNGKENSDFENYIMRDQDKVEIIFE